jgi:hypothetical protein
MHKLTATLVVFAASLAFGSKTQKPVKEPTAQHNSTSS